MDLHDALGDVQSMDLRTGLDHSTQIDSQDLHLSAVCDDSRMRQTLEKHPTTRAVSAVRTRASCRLAAACVDHPISDVPVSDSATPLTLCRMSPLPPAHMVAPNNVATTGTVVTGSSSSPSVDNIVSPSLLASLSISPVCSIPSTISSTNSANGRQKQSGSCPVCFRHMSITSAGVIHKHGLPSNPCAGSGSVPVTATTSVALSNQSTTSSVTGVSTSTNNQRNTQLNSTQNSTDILEILRMHR